MEHHMNIKETKEAIKVMQGHIDGENIEFNSGSGWNPWSESIQLVWDWVNYSYRIAEPEPVEICVGLRLIGNVTETVYIIKCLDAGFVWLQDLSAENYYQSWLGETVIDRLHTLVNGTKRKLKAPEAE